MLAMMLVFTLAGAMAVTPAGAVNAPFFNDMSNATSDNKFGFDGVVLEPGKCVIRTVMDAQQNRNVLEIGGVPANGKDPQPYTVANVAKTDWAKPLAISLRFKTADANSNAKIEVRGGTTAGTRFYNFFTAGRDKTTFLENVFASGTRKSAAYTPNEWHDLTIMVDFPNKKANLAYDSAVAEYDLNLKEDFSEILTDQNAAVRFRSLNRNAKVYYDAVKIYHQEKLQVTAPEDIAPNAGRFEVLFSNDMAFKNLNKNTVTVSKVGGDAVSVEKVYGESIPVAPGSAVSAPKSKMVVEGVRLEPGAAYTVTFDEAVKDVFGSHPESVQVKTLTVPAEAPKVTGITANVDQAETLPLEGAKFQVTFDREMSKEWVSAYTELFEATDGKINTVASMEGNTLTLTPEKPLKYNGVYTVKVAENVMSADGIYIDKEYNKEFSAPQTDCWVTALTRKVGEQADGNLVGGETVTSVFTVKRKNAGEAVVIAALYDDANKCLADIRVEKLQFAEAGTKTSKALTITLPENVEGYSLKNYVFESWNTLIPVLWNKDVKNHALTVGSEK